MCFKKKQKWILASFCIALAEFLSCLFSFSSLLSLLHLEFSISCWSIILFILSGFSIFQKHATLFMSVHWTRKIVVLLYCFWSNCINGSTDQCESWLPGRIFLSLHKDENGRKLTIHFFLYNPSFKICRFFALKNKNNENKQTKINLCGENLM